MEKIIESRSNKIVENKKEMKIDNVGDKIVQGEMESKKEAEPVVFNG